jgi:iron complex outermembrane receptor protein
MHPLRLSIALVLAGLPSAAALAQAGSAPDSAPAFDVGELQTIEVIGRRLREAFAETSFSTTLVETRMLDIPQTISVVTKETIQDQVLMQLNDIAPFVAGVNEFSVYDDLTIRGFRSSDDRRVNGLRTFNAFWSQPYIAHLERIEVIKGPAATTFGAASPGGLINMVTKKPLRESRHELTANVGSYDHRYLAFDSTGPVGKGERLLYRVNASGWDIGSFRENTFDEGYGVAPSLTWIPSAQTRVNLDVVYVDRQSVLDRGQPNVQGAQTLGLVPIEVSITQPGDGIDTRNLSVALSGEYRLNDRWSVAAALMRYDYDEDLVEHRIDNYATPSVIRLRYNDRDTESTIDSGMLYLAGQFLTGPVEHQLVVGVDVLDRNDSQDEVFARRVGTFDVLAPAYPPRDPSTYSLSPSLWTSELESHAGFAQNRMTWGDWDLMLGLRWTEFTDRTLGAEEETHDDFVPRASLVYRLTPDRSVYASWIRGFEAQFGYTPQDGGPFGPTTSQLLEVGYKELAFDGRLMFTAALYEIENNDIVIYANDVANPDLYRQLGQERGRGIELEAVGRVTPNLQVIANYAYSDAEITRDVDPALVGRRKENAPEHSATVWARYDLPFGLGFGAGVTHVSERDTFDAPLQLPSYTLWNAAVYYTTGDLTLRLQGKNLTDEVHWTGGYNFGRVFPGDPRTFVLSAGYRF